VSVAYITTFIALVCAGVAFALETQFSGTGVVIFSLIVAMMIFYLVSWYTSRNEAKTRQAVSERKTHGEEQAAAAGGREWMSGPAPSGETVTENKTDTAGRVGGEPIVEHRNIAATTARARWRARTREADGDTERQRATPYIEELLDPKRSRKSWKSKWKALLIWAALIAGGLYVAFLPYSFEIGGEFVVHPVERAEVRARTAGEVIELLVQEGDWVTDGQVMARLSSWDEERNISLLEAEIAKARADLATLVAGPRPEEVSLSEQRIASAVVKVEYTKREFERQRELSELGAGAAKQVDVTESQHHLALSELEEARAQLQLLKAPAIESEVAAAEAAIERDVSDLEYRRLQLEHTEIKANADGSVVTPLEDLSLGTYLPVGGLFAEVEDSRTVLAEIEVPETEISEAEIGARAEMKLWSSPWESVNGTVRRIAPKAEEREFGRIVRVLVEVPNPNRRLTPNMTGFGKIVAEERPVWEAFTRSIVRFIQIELWSWIP
jgi:multidrug efflux pump subunit AcrA (membrane-fusion protein)